MAPDQRGVDFPDAGRGVHARSAVTCAGGAAPLTGLEVNPEVNPHTSPVFTKSLPDGNPCSRMPSNLLK